MKARERFLAAPAQAAERERSESEHRAESRSEAVQTTQESFASLLDGLDWQGSQLARDDAFEAFSSDYVARVEIDGDSRLIESSVPAARTQRRRQA
ncbi:hypothetical protein GKE82_15160 [Conexibacter sp. W3-3-2]|uniref:hypothetical protein n=1 Tax=Conexibacter sp. W3-3-2 TaxID=2675227 RepID=UPI0012B8E9EE|nr:hypothetical protein [Conexibacter sp. W3-3-2]MTD45589.1 hypothetical protein [Conexibacter sp. W3-3-2]